MLQNLHLMQSWLPILERKFEVVSETAHKNFRMYISAEPPSFSYQKNMPESLMQICIKVSNEAPADMKSNLRRSWVLFDEEKIMTSNKPDVYRVCLFTLCFYHSVILGRRKFGQSGWSRGYPFNEGDLTICANILMAYIKNAPVAPDGSQPTPWADLNYVFAQIMYGGHITDPWDRRTNETYLLVLLNPETLKGLELGPGFKAPKIGLTYDDCLNYIETDLPFETPAMFGMHANAEIGYLTNSCEQLFRTITMLTAGSSGSGGGGSDDVVSKRLEELLKKVPENFSTIGIQLKAEKLLTTVESPYTLVAIQETGRMNVLLDYIRSSMEDLTKGLAGQLNMSQAMEDLAAALAINEVPGRNVFHKCSWENLAWPSKKTLSPWFADFLRRIQQLTDWCAEMTRPISLWLPGLFNPMAYTTAIMQVTGRINEYPLDNMTLETHITQIKEGNDCDYHPQDGGFCHGLYIECARWGCSNTDEKIGGDFDDEVDEEALDLYEVTGTKCGGHLMDSKLKELLPQLPVWYIKAVLVQSDWEPTSVGYMRHSMTIYDCPVYITTFRGPTYLFNATLKTVDNPKKWVLRGTAVIMQSD